MKKVIALILALTVILVASVGATAETKSYKLAYTCQDLSNTYFVEVCNGFKDYCDKMGYEAVIHDGQTAVANQITAFENFIAQGVDAIVVSPIDEKALIPSVAAAQAAGIPVIGACQNVEGTSAFLVIPEFEYGYTIGEHAGKWIAEKLGGEAEVAIFDYPELESIIARGDGIAQGILDQAPNANIVARQSANNPEKGMANMENILQAHPNVEVLVCVNDAGALGAYEVIMAAGKASERWYIGGLDATGEALDKIAEGGIFRATVDIQPYNSGALFAETAVKVVEEGPIADPIIIDMKVVDESNISDYK